MHFSYNPILFLLLWQIDFCLREWSTGTFLQAAFFEKDVLHTHKIYRVEVEAWSNINLAVTSNIRKKLFSRALYVHFYIQVLSNFDFGELLLRFSHNSGVGDKDAAIVSGLVGDAKDRVQTELDGRTGDTDSELSA